jgi:hypothetical protein
MSSQQGHLQDARVVRMAAGIGSVGGVPRLERKIPPPGEQPVIISRASHTCLVQILCSPGVPPTPPLVLHTQMECG